jgi:hypothetical protein
VLIPYLWKKEIMRIVLVVLALFVCINSFPQENAGIPVYSDPLSFSFESISFFRNNEYFNPFREGYTLTGSHLRPLLVWNPVQGLLIRGGAFLELWSGYDPGVRFRPHFSAELALTGSTRLILGSLRGSDSHQMYDQHFDNEKIYTSFQEEGIQFTYKTSSISSDTWINWEEYILPGDNKREELTFGESFRFFAGGKESLLRLEIPLQLLVKHRGGQISNYELAVETHINLAGGGRLIFGGNGTEGGETGVEATLFLYNVNKTLPGIPFQNGKAMWLKADHTFGKISAAAGIWLSDNFYSPNGNTIYSSISEWRDDVHVRNRSLLTGSVDYNKTWDTGIVSLHLGFDWYFDLRTKNFDHSMTIHIRIPERSVGLSKKQGAG